MVFAGYSAYRHGKSDTLRIYHISLRHLSIVETRPRMKMSSILIEKENVCLFQQKFAHQFCVDSLVAGVTRS